MVYTTSVTNRPVTYTDYTIPTSDNHSLGATVITKTIAEENHHGSEIMVICHGLLNSRYSRVVRSLGVSLPYNACIFDFRGNGNSTGSTRYGNIMEEMEDLRFVIEYLRNTLKFTVKVILGHSKGAAVAFQYMAKYNDVPYLVDVAGRFDMSQSPMLRFTEEQTQLLKTKGEFEWLKYGLDQNRSYIIRQRDLDERDRIDMSVVRNIDFNRVQVLLVHGDQDEVVPVTEAQRYYDTMAESETLHHQPSPKLTMEILPKATHSFIENHERDILVETVRKWLAERLG
ncbi:hypothetical protein IWQ62_001370 [Dispira parvispora]|uniref:Serine aminopeptidase S33 domain-containing protein n=1 Tax=Dispira parvispora TaxID=1520584 RepID=A0A9W8E953_9FUNG|nr:hypothetical protein IWQ62_001370 [Dispira parvispora]